MTDFLPARNFLAPFRLVRLANSCFSKTFLTNPILRINPHVICKPTSTDVKEAKSRSRDLGIPCLNALSVPRGQMTFPGFTEPEAYSHRPLNRYQRRMRQHVVGNKIKYQYTRRFPASVVERVVNIPLLPDAYHNGASTNFLYGATANIMWLRLACSTAYEPGHERWRCP